MRVLVTGGAGYIGSHAVKLLARSGYQPVVFDNLSTGHRWALGWGRWARGDLADRDALRTAFEAFDFGGVLHFAGSINVGESVQDPAKYLQNNVVNTLNLLDVMRECGVGRIIFSSSAAVYGVPEAVPIPETHPTRPINPYGEAKLFVERALAAYGEAYGLKWVALRYFNAAGADPEGDLGEAHDPETHLIPLAIQAALGVGPPLRLFGTDYPTPDGTAIRDYVHVSDLARAHLLALEYLAGGGGSVALNLGTGRGYSVREVIRTVEAVTGRLVPMLEAPRRPGDPPALVAAAEQAERTLGWRPEDSDLGNLVRTARAWHIRQPAAGAQPAASQPAGRRP